MYIENQNNIKDLPNKKAVGYIRVSTTAQDFQRQEKQIADYCKASAYTFIKAISEKGSGGKNEREGLLELMSLTKDNADIIVVSELSRISRSDEILEVLTIIQRFLNNGLDIVFLDEPYKIYNRGERLELTDIITLSVKAKSAADERAKIASRMMSGKITKVTSNRNMLGSGLVAYGYKAIPNPEYKMYVTPKTFIEVDEETSKIIINIYNWCLEGLTCPKIALRLQAMGIKSARGIDFSGGAIQEIIKNPIYKGIKKYGNVEVEITPIVSVEVWEKAQKQLITNKVFNAPFKTHFNSLKGIMKCPCGKSMSISNHGNYLYYKCSRKKDKYNTSVCDNANIRVEIVLPLVWLAVKCVIWDERYLEQTNEEVEHLRKELNRLNEDIATQKGLYSNNSKRIDNYIDILGDETDANMKNRYRLKLSELDKTNESITKEISRLEDEVLSINSQIESLQREENTNAEDNLTDKDKAEIYKRYISQVTFYKATKMRTGFLVVSFKNGAEKVYLISSGKNYRSIIEAPDGFVFDKNSGTMSYQVRKKSDNPFSIEYETRIAGFDELVSMFIGNEEYDITEGYFPKK